MTNVVKNSKVSSSPNKGFIATLAGHKVAPHLLMILMFLAGFWGLQKINTQFFPSFDLDVVAITVVWSGANPEDVERSITKPIEEGLRSLDNLDKMTSTSGYGVSAITLTFKDGTDIDQSVDDIKQQIETIILPQDIEIPIIAKAVRYENVGQIYLASDHLEITELVKIAREIEDELLDAGVDKIEFEGYPKMEMAIDIKQEVLQTYGITLNDINKQINNYSIDLPMGSISENVAGRDIRTIQQARTELDFENIPIWIGNNQYLTLKDVATVKLRPKAGEPQVKQGDKQAIILKISRLENSSTLEAANRIKTWERERSAVYADRVDVQVFGRQWVLLQQRIDILIKNGLGGLILVVLVLVLFMNLRVAFWVAMGIPASLLLTMGAFYIIGGSINMISLFAFIMTLGIIVDDAIVVGEHSVHQFENGKSPLDAAVVGANRMLFPVIASSLTTIAAFFPLTLISGVIGKFLITIPIVVICVIIASLIEGFLVLPGHLHHSFEAVKNKSKKSSKWRLFLDGKFNHFRDGFFRSFVVKCLKNRLAVVVFVIVCCIVGISLLTSKRVGFVFFPSVESGTINLEVAFVAGTPENTLINFLAQADKTLQETNKEFGGDILITNFQRIGINASRSHGTTGLSRSLNSGSIYVELTEPDSREITNTEFINAWRKKINLIPGIESFQIAAARGGPGGKDISFQLFSKDINQLKLASLELASAIKNLPGTSNVADDLSYGKDQIIFKLTPFAKNLNITISQISQQVRSALSSVIAQTYYLDRDEIEVRSQLPIEDTNYISTLNSLQIKIGNQQYIPLSNLVTWSTKKGFDSIRHYDTKVSVNVFADLDTDKATLNDLLPTLTNNVLPELRAKYGIDWTLEGSAKRQQQTFGDMITGMLIGLMLIYITLVWVFNSWGWPFIIVTIIPLGLFGAIVGHWVIGINMNILSLFGLFGLSGIVINDSIVLVTTYRNLKEQGVHFYEALVESACLRLRAVLLTSITTICGLTPLLFETSLQAQFLIPMATTIAFGLAFATLVILIVVPTLLSFYEQIAHFMVTKKSVKYSSFN